MSQDPRGLGHAPSAAPGGAKIAGSVRAARERAQAGLPPRTIEPRPIPTPTPTPTLTQARTGPGTSIPALIADQNQAYRNGNGPKLFDPPRHTPITRPTLVPQWPLTAEIGNTLDMEARSTADARDTQEQKRDWAEDRDGANVGERQVENFSFRPPQPFRWQRQLQQQQQQQQQQNSQPKGARATPTLPTIDTSRAQNFQGPPHPNPQGPFYQQHQQQQYPQQQRNWEPQDASSTPGTGVTSSTSRPSTGSSFGSIPEFPVPEPAPLQTPRRSAGLGPPPSARRGASSNYSQSSYVAPIPEERNEGSRSETPHRGRDSDDTQTWVGGLMRSSTADGGAPFVERNEYEYDDDDEKCSLDGQDSRSTDPDESTGLVRKASLGKQYRPSLTTVRRSSGSSAEGARKIYNRPIIITTEDHELDHISYDASVGSGRVAARGPDLQPGYLAADAENFSTSSSEYLQAGSPSSRSPSSVDPRMEQILGGLEKGGAIRSGTAMPAVTPPSARSPVDPAPVSTPPPARLRVPNQERPAKAGSRVSMTSLTDLIRRATRVASNLDRGRTASRLDILDLFNGSDPDRKNRSGTMSPDDPRVADPTLRQRNSISDMLASFPPPALSTPPLSQAGRSYSNLNSPIGNHSGHNLSRSMTSGPHKGHSTLDEQRRRSTRYCGLPGWAFLLVILLVIALVAAAVIVPIALIVLPHQNQAAAPANTTSGCATSSPCANGGMSVVSNSSCGCVCANGFTGSKCDRDESKDSACTTSKIDTFSNATTGASIPRLIDAAESNFSIPLNASALLASFAAQEMSCDEQNKLVLFNGTSQRKRRRDVEPFGSVGSNPEAVVLLADVPMPLVTNVPRGIPVSGDTAGVTSNGIIVAAAPSSTSGLSQTRTGTAATTASTSGSSPPADMPSPHELDFARVAVLYVLQQITLPRAVDVQTALEAKLGTTPFIADAVLAPGNVTVDFLRGRVTLNGLTVGQ